MRQRRTRLIALVTAIATAAALSACGGEADSGDGSAEPVSGDGSEEPASEEGAEESASGNDGDPFRVVAFTAGYGTPVGKSTLDSFVERGEELGWDVTLHTSDFDYDVINTDVVSSITQGVDAVLAGFPDPRQIAPLVTAAEDAGVPIFSIDGGVEPNEDFVVDVTTSQQQIAELTVGALEDAMGGLDGKDVMIIGHDPHVGIMTRSGIARDLLTEAGATITPDEIRQVTNPGSSQEEALTFVTDHLQANPDGLDGVWTGWDHAGLGAAQAVSEAGRDDIYVTGVDAIGIALAEIESGGPFYATVVQDWTEILDMTMTYLENYQDAGELPDENFVEIDVTLVTEENAADIEPTG